jgi:hypothetical protein
MELVPEGIVVKMRRVSRDRRHGVGDAAMTRAVHFAAPGTRFVPCDGACDAQTMQISKFAPRPLTARSSVLRAGF